MNNGKFLVVLFIVLLIACSTFTFISLNIH